MILASDGHSGLIRRDSLDPPETIPPDFLRQAGPGIPTVILTNPPFGATSEHRITAENSPEILAQFDIGHVWRKDAHGELQPTTQLSGEGVPPEYLFLERCIRWVHPGGKIGIVVPRGVLDNDKALPLRTLILRETRVLAVVNCHDDTFKPYTDAKAALLVLERKRTQSKKEDDYATFMAISQAIGHTGLGEPIYRTDSVGATILVGGQPVLDQDTDDIYAAWEAAQAGKKPDSEWYFSIKRSDLNPVTLNLNPVRYLPKYNRSRQKVLELGSREGWEVERLGHSNIAKVFGGYRLKRPYAEKGVTSGPTIVRFFTGNAVTQTRGENVKYLDLRRANANQLKMIEAMTLRRGMILITRSGTTGRVVYATAYHEGAVGTEDVIRVVVEDDALRGYVYQFLSSRLGQDQLKRNVYGAIVDHLEPDEVKDVIIPIPKDRKVLEEIGMPVIRSMELQELAYKETEASRHKLASEMDEETAEDSQDAEIARKRLEELTTNPKLLISGAELEERIRDLLA